MRAVIFVLASVLLVIGRAPGFLLDLAAQKISREEIRIARIEGLVWHGQGVIDVLDVVSHSWHAWRTVQWEFDPLGLFEGKLRWHFLGDGVPATVVEVGIDGWTAKDLHANGPARYFLQRIPLAYARTGWGGEVQVASDAFGCNWAERCSGRIDVNWLDASWELLPTMVFGDYRIRAEGRDYQIVLTWQTIKGEVRIEGRATIDGEHAHQLDAEVSGNPLLLSRLPAIAGPWARPTVASEVWRIAYP